MKHTRIKMLCIVVGMMLLLSTVVRAVSMGGISLLHIAGDAETGELPDGTALSIAEAISEEYSPEELITNTYHKDFQYHRSNHQRNERSILLSDFEEDPAGV